MKTASRPKNAADAIAVAGSSSKVIVETGDVAQSDFIEGALDNIVERVGNIDIFACNACMLPREASVCGYSEAEFRWCFEVDFMGSFYSVQAFVRLAAPGAKVFNIGPGISHWALLPEVPGIFGCAAQKAADLKILDYFASENPEIHVVSIQPGIIATEINPNTTVGQMRLPAEFLLWFEAEEGQFLKSKFVWANWDAQELMAQAEEIQGSMLPRVDLNGVDI